MKIRPIFPLLLIVGITFAGCSGPAERDSTTNFGARFVNETDADYFIYVFLPQFPGDKNGDENGFAKQGGGFSSLFDCQGHLPNVPSSFWMRIEVREPKPNHEDIWAPEIKGGPIVFEGNWTGLRCGGEYIFEYNGPEDVAFYEIYDFVQDERKKKDLERVPP